MPKTFIINDEKKVNSYGFRVLNAGINLDRFKGNPVMLNDHWNSTAEVLGRWSNVRVDGSTLMADAEFDAEDDLAVKMSGKVDRGYIKSCSMGITFDRSLMKAKPDGSFVLEACELMEVSLVAVPSNANALTLFTPGGELMEASEVKLSLQNFKNIELPKKVNMEKIMLSVVAMTILGFQEAQDSAVLSAQVEKLGADLKAANEKVATLKTESENAAKLNAEGLVDGAIAEGRLNATVREDFIKMATGNYKTAATVIAAMPAKKSLKDEIDNSETGVKTMDDFEKLSAAEKLAFKSEKPEAYKNLFK